MVLPWLGMYRVACTVRVDQLRSSAVKVLFVTPECYPLVKTGGLADVTGALPLALSPFGVDARVLLPSYTGVRDQLVDAKQVASLPDLFGAEGELVSGTTAHGLQVLLVEAPHLYDRSGGGLYLGPDGLDWPDNHLRFGALSWVGALMAKGLLTDWRPDVVHLHDWQAALTAAYLRFGRSAATKATSRKSAKAPAPTPVVAEVVAEVVADPARPATLLTIHNLAFQGLFDAHLLPALGLPPAALDVDGMEYWGHLSFLKAGVQWCDAISTVSPTYAREVLTTEQGMGFDGALRARSDRLIGIANGIDDSVWNPATDPDVVAPYSVRRLAAKSTNKSALQAELSLDLRADAPLFCVVSRLTTQKGLDLLLAALPRVMTAGGQLAVLGSGDRDLEDGFRRAAEEHHGRVAVHIGYDEPLSHRMQAGADAIIVPSRFEPCGLTQLYGLRYGTLPVVARVGGLADTVIDANGAALRDGVATGFQFSPVEVGPLAEAIERACDLFADTLAWQRVVKRAMTRDVGWGVAAGAYVDLYERLVTRA